MPRVHRRNQGVATIGTTSGASGGGGGGGSVHGRWQGMEEGGTAATEGHDGLFSSQTDLTAAERSIIT